MHWTGRPGRKPGCPFAWPRKAGPRGQPACRRLRCRQRCPAHAANRSVACRPACRPFGSGNCKPNASGSRRRKATFDPATAQCRRETQPRVHHMFLASRLDQPDIARRVNVVGRRFRHVDVASMRHHQIIAANARGNNRRFPDSIVRNNFFVRTGDRIETPVRPKGLAGAFPGIEQELAHLAVEANLVGLAGGSVVEENFALRVGGRTVGGNATLRY